MTHIHALILIVGILIGYAGGYARRRILESQLDNMQVMFERQLRENEIWRGMHPETEPEVREMMTLPVYSAAPIRYPDPRDALDGGL